MFIEPRRAVSVDELLRGMVIASGNDASIALAELTDGSEEAFVARMNREAARLGMANSHFTNVTGLSALSSETAPANGAEAPAPDGSVPATGAVPPAGTGSTDSSSASAR